MASRSNYYPPEKPMAQVLSELKEELKEFIATRIAILRTEMQEKYALAGAAVAFIAGGAALALVAGLFLCVAIAALLALAFGGGAGAWAAGFAIVGGGLLLIGGVAIGFGVSKLKNPGLKPERTLRILKEDQIWLQNESRGKL